MLITTRNGGVRMIAVFQKRRKHRAALRSGRRHLAAHGSISRLLWRRMQPGRRSRCILDEGRWLEELGFESGRFWRQVNIGEGAKQIERS
eukprot:4465634-Pleurochrysis_carterae.AAC.1